MITYKTTACRGFVLCSGNGALGDLLTQPNVGSGYAMQYVYSYNGTGEITDGSSTTSIPHRTLTSLEAYMDREANFRITSDTASWVTINPLDNNRFDAELITAGHATVSGGAKRKFILCLEGTIECNSVALQAETYAPVPSASVVSVTVPQNAVALVLTTR